MQKAAEQMLSGLILLADKQDTQGAGTTVAGDGATGTGLFHRVKLAILRNGILDSSKAFLGHGGVGQEQ